MWHFILTHRMVILLALPLLGLLNSLVRSRRKRRGLQLPPTRAEKLWMAVYAGCAFVLLVLGFWAFVLHS